MSLLRLVLAIILFTSNFASAKSFLPAMDANPVYQMLRKHGGIIGQFDGAKGQKRVLKNVVFRPNWTPMPELLKSETLFFRNLQGYWSNRNASLDLPVEVNTFELKLVGKRFKNLTHTFSRHEEMIMGIAAPQRSFSVITKSTNIMPAKGSLFMRAAAVVGIKDLSPGMRAGIHEGAQIHLTMLAKVAGNLGRFFLGHYPVKGI